MEVVSTYYFLYKFDYYIIMALELIIWSLLAGVGGIAFVLGLIYKVQFIFVLACILIAVSGMSLFVYDGLIVDTQLDSVADDGSFVYSDTIISTSNIGLFSLALVLIVIPLVSFLVFDFSPRTAKIPKVFHY